MGEQGFPFEEGRLRHSLAMTVVTMMVAASSLDAQASTPLFGVDAELGDYGLTDLSSVMRGRVSLVHDPAGDRIQLNFVRSTEVPPPPPPAPPEAIERPSEAPIESGLKALWVWNTAELIRDSAERDVFLTFVETQGIERIFLYLASAEGARPSAGYIPFDGSALAPLLAALHARGALTYALDGDPNYVREENRAGILRTVRRVAEHNRTHEPEERFLGVRYDVEPYLLPGFQGPQRGQILGDYVSMLADVAEEAHAAGLLVGADVPFWFDGGDEETGEPFEAELDGERRPVLEHVMAVVDDMAIMAYRTDAYGPSGALVRAAGEVELGRRSGVGVFVGVETTRLYDEELYTFRGEARVGIPTLRDAAWVFLEDRGDGRVRVWFANGEEAVATLERQTPDVEALRYWFAGRPVSLPGDWLSFYSLGSDAMETVTGQIVFQFGDDPAFLGLAFHDYRGLSALLER